ncbi:hypothetical protein [Cryobacterium sp. GrIS_2_6]|uniref:hypothetical protein n=1 Tax=Cryobacterium sp. GrIS_2_6 TaxID=3162785 RepID=UPI002DFE287B|nr:hypothetical protein [Cryobacterium psychrotolerans]
MRLIGPGAGEVLRDAASGRPVRENDRFRRGAAGRPECDEAQGTGLEKSVSVRTSPTRRQR